MGEERETCAVAIGMLVGMLDRGEGTVHGLGGFNKTLLDVLDPTNERFATCSAKRPKKIRMRLFVLFLSPPPPLLPPRTSHWLSRV
jgi:hypothetical protein